MFIEALKIKVVISAVGGKGPISVYYRFLPNLLRMMKEDTMCVCGFFFFCCFFLFALLYYYFLGVLYLPFI